jgi:CRISPR-associated endonuclease Cas2
MTRPPRSRFSSNRQWTPPTRKDTDAVLGVLRHCRRPPPAAAVGRVARFGTRVQESVFQCLIEPSLAEEMLARVRRTIELNTDKVDVLALCDTCGQRVSHYGIAPEASDPEYLIV